MSWCNNKKDIVCEKCKQKDTWQIEKNHIIPQEFRRVCKPEEKRKVSYLCRICHSSWHYYLNHHRLGKIIHELYEE